MSHVLVVDLGNGGIMRLARNEWETLIDVITIGASAEGCYIPPSVTHLYFNGSQQLQEMRDSIDATLQSILKFEKEHGF